MKSAQRNCTHPPKYQVWANEKKGLVECTKCGARKFIGERGWVPKYAPKGAPEGK